jgi:hypothetical protein
MFLPIKFLSNLFRRLFRGQLMPRRARVTRHRLIIDLFSGVLFICRGVFVTLAALDSIIYSHGIYGFQLFFGAIKPPRGEGKTREAERQAVRTSNVFLPSLKRSEAKRREERKKRKSDRRGRKQFSPTASWLKTNVAERFDD